MDDGSCLSHSKEIYEAFKEFNVKLYTSESKVGKKNYILFANSQFPSVSKDQLECLDSPITIEEIADVIKQAYAKELAPL